MVNVAAFVATNPFPTEAYKSASAPGNICRDTLDNRAQDCYVDIGDRDSSVFYDGNFVALYAGDDGIEKYRGEADMFVNFGGADNTSLSGGFRNIADESGEVLGVEFNVGGVAWDPVSRVFSDVDVDGDDVLSCSALAGSGITGCDVSASELAALMCRKMRRRII